MDFEDFLAAHLNADPAGLPDALADLTKPAGMLHASIPKRINSLALPAGQKPALADILEIPGVSETHPVYAPLLNLVFQQTRFAWFRADDTLAPLHVDPLNNALLNAKAFNHLLNSVSGTRRPLPFSADPGTDIVTSPGHGLATGQPVFVQTSGTLPAPLVLGTTYYVRSLSPDTLTLHLLVSEAFAGLPVVDLTTIGAAAHNLLYYGYSYYSYDGINIPFAGTPADTPKFEYVELTQAALDAATVPSDRQYVLERNAAIPNEPGELRAWRATNGSGYYEMTFPVCDDVQLVEYGSPAPPILPDTERELVGIGVDLVLQTPTPLPTYDDKLGITKPGIVDGGDLICQSTVHGLLRAYRHSKDDPATAPLATRVSGLALNGDVSWSPRFAFRSRFFSLYVLARGLQTNGLPYPGGPRRVEALYDALKDKVLWHRQQSSEKRSLLDPEP